MSYTQRGSLDPVLGRKFCRTCGRWRLLVDFNVDKRKNGKIVRFASDCKTCSRLKARERRLNPLVRASRREYERIYLDAKRRQRGVPARRYARGGKRDRGRGSYKDAVPAGPFVEWLDDWVARQDEMRTTSMAENERAVAGLEDLASLAGCSAKAFWRARNEGRISLAIVDRVLVRAGDCMWHDLFPESEYPELYVFDDAEVAA